MKNTNRTNTGRHFYFSKVIMKRIVSVFCLILVLLTSVACNNAEELTVVDVLEPSGDKMREDVNVSACEEKYQLLFNNYTKLELGQAIPTKNLNITCAFTEVKFEDSKMCFKAILTNTSDSESWIFLYTNIFGNEGYNMFYQILNSGKHISCYGGREIDLSMSCDSELCDSYSNIVTIPSGESVEIYGSVSTSLGTDEQLEDDFYVFGFMIQGRYCLELAGTKK